MLSRLLIVLMLFIGMCGPVVAGQFDPDGLKDRRDTEEATETPKDDATKEPLPDYPGLVADGEYESPLYGTSISWTDAWIIDESLNEPIGSNEDRGYDWINLINAGRWSTNIYITIERSSSSDPDEILDMITGEGYNEDVLGIDPDSNLLRADSTGDAAAILIVDESGDEPLVVLMEVHPLRSGLVAFIDVRAVASAIDEDVLTALVEDLEINSQPGLTVMTVDEVLAELEDI